MRGNPTDESTAMNGRVLPTGDSCFYVCTRVISEENALWRPPARTTTGCGLSAGDYFFGRTWSDLPGPIPACRAQVWRRRVGRNCRSAHYSHQTRPRLMNLGWELGLGNFWPKTHDSKYNRPSAIRTSVISSPISDLRPPTSALSLLPASPLRQGIFLVQVG